MAAGLQVWSQDGTNILQIDAEGGYPNFQLRQKMVQTLVGGNFPAYTVSGGARWVSSGCLTTFTFYALGPLVAFECPDGYAVPLSFSVNGNTYSVTFVGPSPATVILYVFDQNNFTVNNNFGFQVFNSAGALVADLTTPFAKPVGFASGNVKYAVGSTGWASDGGTWGVAQGGYGFNVPQKVAVACVQPAYAVGGTNGGANNAGVYLSTFNTSGNVVNVAMNSFGDNKNSNNYVGFREALGWQFMGIDVSFL